MLSTDALFLQNTWLVSDKQEGCRQKEVCPSSTLPIPTERQTGATLLLSKYHLDVTLTGEHLKPFFFWLHCEAH